MARRDTIRQRILAVERMFLSGEPLTAQKIIRKLDLEYDIQVDRKTVYQDIAELSRFMMICKVGNGRGHVYRLVYLDDLLKE